jgi:hypothetical protein
MQHYFKANATHAHSQSHLSHNHSHLHTLKKQPITVADNDASLRNGISEATQSDALSPLLRHNGRKPKINKKPGQDANLSKCVPAGKRYQAKKQSTAEQEVQDTPAEAYDQPLQNHCGFTAAG